MVQAVGRSANENIFSFSFILPLKKRKGGHGHLLLCRMKTRNTYIVTQSFTIVYGRTYIKYVLQTYN